MLHQVWNTDTPMADPQYVSQEEVETIWRSLGISEEKISKKPKEYICDQHKPHGHTKKMMEEVTKHNRANTPKKNG